MKRILSVALMLVLSLTLVACNTVEGFGKDIKKVGSKIEKAGDK